MIKLQRPRKWCRSLGARRKCGLPLDEMRRCASGHQTILRAKRCEALVCEDPGGCDICCEHPHDDLQVHFYASTPGMKPGEYLDKAEKVFKCGRCGATIE